MSATSVLRTDYGAPGRVRAPAPTTKSPLLVVIYANPDYYPPTVSAVNLLRKCFAVHVLCRNMGEAVINWPRDVVVRRFGRFASPKDKQALGILSKIAEYVSFVRAVNAAIRVAKPEILYACDVHALTAVLIGRAGRSVPLVFHAHEHIEPPVRRLASLQAWVTGYAVRNARRAALVVQPEKYRARHYMQVARDERPPEIVPNCPSLDLIPRPAGFASLVERRWHEKEILYTATLGRETGVLEAIAALAFLDHKPRLRLFGMIPAEEFKAEMVHTARSLGVEGQVCYEGFVPLQALITRTMEASVGLVLYRGSTFNSTYNVSATNKLYEYAARGIPAIVSDRESYREFLAHDSWVLYAKPGDPTSIAQAIRQVFQDHDQYGRMCYAARQAFEERYNYETVFQPVLQRIMSLAGNKEAD